MLMVVCRRKLHNYFIITCNTLLLHFPGDCHAAYVLSSFLTLTVCLDPVICKERKSFSVSLAVHHSGSALRFLTYSSLGVKISWGTTFSQFLQAPKLEKGKGGGGAATGSATAVKVSPQ